MMNNTIGEALVTLLDGVVDIRLSEESADRRPYAVYAIDVSPTVIKGGVAKLSGTMTIDIYADTYDALEGIAQAVRQKVQEGLQNRQYRHQQTSSGAECVDGVWHWSLVYNVGQYF